MLKEYLRAKSVVRKLHVLRPKQDCKLRLAEMGLQFNMSDVVKIWTLRLDITKISETNTLGLKFKTKTWKFYYYVKIFPKHF